MEEDAEEFQSPDLPEPFFFFFMIFGKEFVRFNIFNLHQNLLFHISDTTTKKKKFVNTPLIRPVVDNKEDAQCSRFESVIND